MKSKGLCQLQPYLSYLDFRIRFTSIDISSIDISDLDFDRMPSKKDEKLDSSLL